MGWRRGCRGALMRGVWAEAAGVAANRWLHTRNGGSCGGAGAPETAGGGNERDRQRGAGIVVRRILTSARDGGGRGSRERRGVGSRGGLDGRTAGGVVERGGSSREVGGRIRKEGGSGRGAGAALGCGGWMPLSTGCGAAAVVVVKGHGVMAVLTVLMRRLYSVIFVPSAAPGVPRWEGGEVGRFTRAGRGRKKGKTVSPVPPPQSLFAAPNILLAAPQDVALHQKNSLQYYGCGFNWIN
ncbi:hypothetical protein C8F04DRAFT_1180767 [Mycena alexandri]|uniref:Uncharacterized protein n=1 Tax=Mycena alexandri TaxID=1745969 RepID=A0AAD6X691_9AGAR|nr:hypothetical protein C8F04DRAFT_1180767 [Mycena alexandri]